MQNQRLRYIEDENANWTNVEARWYSNNNVKATPMFIFPVPQGKWSVEVSTEGYQPTSSTTDPNNGKCDGLIAYSDDDKTDVWNVGVQKNLTISNNKADNTWKYGHPDLEINSCKFNNRQVLERDAYISFHVETTGPNASFFLVAPPVQKTARYNYAVSYGAWTDRMMEFGSVTVALDEHLEGGNSSRYIRKTPRPGHLRSSRTYGLQLLPHMDDFIHANTVAVVDGYESSSSIDKQVFVVVDNHIVDSDNETDESSGYASSSSEAPKLPAVNQSKLPPKGFLSKLKDSEIQSISDDKPSEITEPMVRQLADATRQPFATGMYDDSFERLSINERKRNFDSLKSDIADIEKTLPKEEYSVPKLPRIKPPTEVDENHQGEIQQTLAELERLNVWDRKDEAEEVSSPPPGYPHGPIEARELMPVEWMRPDYEPPKPKKSLFGRLKSQAKDEASSSSPRNDIRRSSLSSFRR
nr:MAG: ORF5 [Bean leafroll virus]